LIHVGQGGTGSFISESALHVAARARFAKIILSRTIGRICAPLALPRRIALEATTAIRIHWLVHMGRHSIRAQVFRACIVVVGDVRSAILLGRVSDCVAELLLAIARRRRNFFTYRLEDVLAFVVSACTNVASIVHRKRRAIANIDTFEAFSTRIAYAATIGQTSRIKIGRRECRFASHAAVFRTQILVVWQIGVIRNRRALAIDTNLLRTITDDRQVPRSQQTVEVRKRAGTRARIAGIFGTRVSIIARFLGTALDRAFALFAQSRRIAERTRSAVDKFFMHLGAIGTTVDGA